MNTDVEINAALDRLRDLRRSKEAVLRVRTWAVREDLEYVAFLRALRAEGLTLRGIAERARLGRTHLSEMLQGRRSGRQSWKHFLPFVPRGALFHLKQCRGWNAYAEAEAAEKQIFNHGLHG